MPPTTMLMPTVTSATTALRPAAERMPEESTLRQASSVGVNDSRKGSLSCSGFLKLARAIHAIGNSTEMPAAHSSATRQIVSASERLMTAWPCPSGGTRRR